MDEYLDPKMEFNSLGDTLESAFMVSKSRIDSMLHDLARHFSSSSRFDNLDCADILAHVWNGLEDYSKQEKMCFTFLLGMKKGIEEARGESNGLGF